MNSFETETHSKDLNTIYPDKITDIENFDFSINNKSSSNFKAELRLFRKKIMRFFKQRQNNFFKNVLLITLGDLPIDFIKAFQKQYPDKIISILTAIDDTDGLENTSIRFEYYLQNRINTAGLYKFPRNIDNINIYGLYSPAFSGFDRTRLQYLAPFVKAARICAKKLSPDVIHADNIPFFLGEEFEKVSYPIKVVQIIKDFSQFETNKTEAFWTAINLVDKKGMKRICRDKIIKKCIASLFNLHNTRRFYQLRECLEFIYMNYFKFRKYIDKCEDIDENILFSRMNARVLQLFPQMAYEDDMFCNAMYHTLKKTNFWAVISKTYYDEIFNFPELSGKLYNRILNTKNKSSYVLYGCDARFHKIYQQFNSENFRDLRDRNKKYLIKEFSPERIKAKFLDIKLFEEENYTIHGYLDSFYNAPLIFIGSTNANDILGEGIDIDFNVIFKLFELNKNLLVIINIPDGLKNDYIKTRINFLEKNYSLNGRWIFIDGKINLAQFYSASDMAFFPRRINPTKIEHYLSMKYGCIPVVSRTGIYNDTVADIFDDITYGCGFKTKIPLTRDEDANKVYCETVLKALNIYSKNPASWNLLIKNAMNYDSGWKFNIIEQYNSMYDKK